MSTPLQVIEELWASHPPENRCYYFCKANHGFACQSPVPEAGTFDINDEPTTVQLWCVTPEHETCLYHLDPALAGKLDPNQHRDDEGYLIWRISRKIPNEPQTVLGIVRAKTPGAAEAAGFQMWPKNHEKEIRTVEPATSANIRWRRPKR